MQSCDIGLVRLVEPDYVSDRTVNTLFSTDKLTEVKGKILQTVLLDNTRKVFGLV